jgi:hypothetical protein
MPSTLSSMPCQPAHTHLEGHRRAGCRISRIAASAAIPSGWAHGTGPHHAACDTLSRAEAVSGCPRWPRHMRHPVNCCRAREPHHRVKPPNLKGLRTSLEDGASVAPDQRSRHPTRLTPPAPPPDLEVPDPATAGAAMQGWKRMTEGEAGEKSTVVAHPDAAPTTAALPRLCRPHNRRRDICRPGLPPHPRRRQPR